MCLEPYPMNPWRNSTLFWPQTLPCSSSGSRVNNGRKSTCGGHMSCVWNHVHWIPGKILPHFDPSHSPVAYLEAELEIDMCRHVSTRGWHVLRVWDHVHWIPGEILPHFDPSHSPVAYLEADLEIMQKIEQERLRDLLNMAFLHLCKNQDHFCIPIWP